MRRCDAPKRRVGTFLVCLRVSKALTTRTTIGITTVFLMRDLNDICDECKKEDESVSQNLILTGFKLCKSCRVSKTIFPI